MSSILLVLSHSLSLSGPVHLCNRIPVGFNKLPSSLIVSLNSIINLFSKIWFIEFTWIYRVEYDLIFIEIKENQNRQVDWIISGRGSALQYLLMHKSCGKDRPLVILSESDMFHSFCWFPGIWQTTSKDATWLCFITSHHDIVEEDSIKKHKETGHVSLQLQKSCF